MLQLENIKFERIKVTAQNVADDQRGSKIRVRKLGIIPDLFFHYEWSHRKVVRDLRVVFHARSLIL